MIEKLPLTLQKRWQEKEFQAASQVQEEVIPELLANHSVLAISPTGTGKTLAYLLPILSLTQPNRQLQSLVFVPSQELARQIYEVAQEWGQGLGLTIQCLIGGANKRNQIQALKEKPEVIIATPGRFAELLKESAKLKVHQVQRVIYDEADYLFQADSQLDQDLALINHRLMRDVAKSYFSASYHQDLKDYLADQALDRRFELTQPVSTIQHIYLTCQNRRKVAMLKHLAFVEGMQAIVFFDQINDLEIAAAKLIYEGIPIVALHSQLSKIERQRAFEIFSKGQAIYLLTTDLAARGIDLPEIPYVIQFDRVSEADTYIHRSGRTGRMGQAGTVISLLNQQEVLDLKRILDGQGIDLNERFLYQSQLLADKPEKKEGSAANKPANKSSKKSSKRSSKKRTSQKNGQPVKKKSNKKRHAVQKNKGKRRNKA
ncbi:DEAD/DEAH box helicase [Facklamia hominis]